MSVSETWNYRIKAAQRDLIKRAGGIERAAELTAFSKSQVGRWNNAADPDLMPLVAVVVLEADTGAALVTAIMAEINGRRLSDPEEEKRSQATVFATFAEAKRHDAELTHSFSMAIADAYISSSEAEVADRKAAAQIEALTEFRASLAAVKAQGGSKAGLRVVGDD